jgi:hypothetical protein
MASNGWIPINPQNHAFVEPAIMIELAIYEQDLVATRIEWKQVWP